MTDIRPSRADDELTRVGPYEILTRLGEGGMGVVHLARHADSGERVALKVLRTNVVGDEETRQRLEREVRSLGQVRSPWVAEIVDADPFADTPYVATRYVPGPTLHERVKADGPMLGEDRFWLARCLAAGVAACHDAGVLHRDVKPSNVVMEGSTPVLIDFGIARVADDPKITLTGWLIGTPGYLAPEIVEGEEATAASDVHSWAATTAYALLGRPPFGTGPSMAVLDRVRRGQHDLGGIEGTMRDVLADALATDPQARPGLEELREWLMEPETAWCGGRADAVTEVLRATLPLTAVEPPAADEIADEIADEVAVEEIAPTAVTVAEAPDAPVVVRRFDPSATPPPAPAPEPDWGRPSRHSSLRRWPGPMHFLILVALAAILAGVVAAYPVLGATLVGIGVWSLRGLSLAGEHLAKRRELRGRKWYDAPRVLVRSPWDLVRAVPGTVVLSVLTGVIAAAVGVGAAVLDLPLTAVLFAAAMTFMAASWLASERVRDTLGPVARAASTSSPRWIVALVALVILAVAIVWAAAQAGVSWVPLEGVGASGLPDRVREVLGR
ncbi:serine/threonine protein kinase [Nocardioides albertanoniae]|uniref:Serine/threonine protein kinase n=1 Tax=Nocardioides albertanoniae TaxID=1175486 RepID=A0A543AC33_9ACTN|nr:serine/threonine-protein kinase [Nocardioides albertanoniae]TQL70129.1 serine/threonine protein kinase [Nocardioides albertanoniae]